MKCNYRNYQNLLRKYSRKLPPNTFPEKDRVYMKYCINEKKLVAIEEEREQKKNLELHHRNVSMTKHLCKTIDKTDIKKELDQKLFKTKLAMTTKSTQTMYSTPVRCQK